MNAKTSIRVVIADDLALMRSGLRAFLAAYQDINLVGEAGDGEEVVQLCDLLQPDVALMDLKMPVMDGIQATRLIRQRWPNVRVLALTNIRDKALIQEALKAGAADYLSKDITADELAEAIRRVQQGKRMALSKSKREAAQAELLEGLGQVSEMAGADLTRLAGLLRQQLPRLFPGCQIDVHLYPDRKLFCYPADRAEHLPEALWGWLRGQAEAVLLPSGSSPPWGEGQALEGEMILAPLVSPQGRQPLGGIGILQVSERQSLKRRLAFVQELGGRIALAASQPSAQKPRSSSKDLREEMADAGKIQAGILPEKPPQLRGWDIAARLEPALQTSGDFYDFIPLANNNWGVLIADVSDKGMGAALFMALSNTLIRTYAIQYATLPSFAIGLVNERILSDTRNGMFVTAFYGVLEPDTGRMRYVNAGHNPPYLLSGQKGKPVDRLGTTGMALGVDENARWGQKLASFTPGDVLVLYTDGVTEAQDRVGRFYGEARLLEVIRPLRGRTAKEILEAVLVDVRRFSGGAALGDDVTLIVVRRQGE
ncbi:MAG: SpoIIE family protein phosphatase [Anaerolineales bacterium]|nr:SpoIIE family protein phosphatase [Anaerolineales bacterium]